MISTRQIDQLLLAFCDTRWRKVARIIGNSMKILSECRIRPSGTLAKIIDMRMAALVANGRLEAQGNIRKWRYSEVRLPDHPPMLQARIPVSLLRTKKIDNRTPRGKRIAKIQTIHLPLSMLLQRAR
jgi:hypothetical protein